MILKATLHFYLLVIVVTIFVLIKMIISNIENKKLSQSKNSASDNNDWYIIKDEEEINKYIDNLQKSYTIIFDFNNVIDEESFWNEIQNKFTRDCDWFGRNWDAFWDALCGGCGLFEEYNPVNVSIINIKNISNNEELNSLFVTMLDVLLDRVYEIKSDNYCLKYIENLKNEVKSIHKCLCTRVFISLRLYENDIV